MSYIDATYGLAGDMFVAAMIDLGVPLSHIQEQLKHLVTGYETSCVRFTEDLAAVLQVSPDQKAQKLEHLPIHIRITLILSLIFQVIHIANGPIFGSLTKVVGLGPQL